MHWFRGEKVKYGKAEEESKGRGDPEIKSAHLYLCPEICPMTFPSVQKQEQVEFASPRSFLGEISPMYW